MKRKDCDRGDKIIEELKLALDQWCESSDERQKKKLNNRIVDLRAEWMRLNKCP